MAKLNHIKGTGKTPELAWISKTWNESQIQNVKGFNLMYINPKFVPQNDK